MISVSLVYDYAGPSGKFYNGINFDFFSPHIEADFKNEFNLDNLLKKYGNNAVGVWNGDGPINYAVDESITTYDVLNGIDKNKTYLYSISPFGGAACAYGLDKSLHDGRSFFHFISVQTKYLIQNVNNFYLFINYSNEGTLDLRWFDVIYRDAEIFDIPLEKIIFCISDFNIDENFNKWYDNFINRKENIGKHYKKIKVLYHNWSLRDKSNEIDRIITGEYNGWRQYSNSCTIASANDITLNIRDKKFLMLNRRLRPHRILSIIIFKYLNILDNFLISYDFNKMQVFDLYEHHLEGYVGIFYNSKELYQIFDNFLIHNPVSIIDFDELEDVWGFNFENKEPYLNSYIHITAETNFFERGGYFSEKTWKPMAHLQPFIFMGPANGLEQIKSLGFKTFSPFIDESYDNEKDPILRFKMILDEIKRLSELPIEKIHEWYHSILENTLIYNQQLFLSYADGTKMREIFNKNLEEVLR